jgi:predicted secreted protein
MNWFVGVAMYIVIWWLAIFAVLPWGVRAADKSDLAHASGAPANPRLWFKVGMTSIVAAVLWLIMFALIYFGVFTFR